MLDAAGRVLATNAAWQRGGVCCLGVPEPVVAGADLLTLLDGFVGERRDAALDIAAGLRAVADGKSDTFQSRVQTPGVDQWQEVTVRRFLDPGGEPRLLLTRRDVTTQQRIDQALHETERRYQAVVEGQTEMICRFLPDTTLSFVNQAYCRHFDRTPEQLLGHSFLELVPPSVHAELREGLDRLTPENPINTKTHRVIKPDGGEAWHTWTDRAFFDGRRHLIEFQSVGRDVTERIESQEKIRLSEQRYRAAAEGGLDAFFVLDAVRSDDGTIVDFRFVDLNERGADLVSRTRQQVLGQSMLTLLPVNRGDNFFPRFVQVVETGQPIFDEFAIDAASQGIRAAFIQRQVVAVGDGIAISARDITDRKRTEHALEDQRNQNQVILDAIPALVFYKDAHNRILRVNAAAAEAAGLSPSEMEGKHTRELYPRFADSYHRDDLAVMASGKPKLGYLEKMEEPGSDPSRWIRTDKVPIFDDAGEAQGVLAIATDVTEMVETAEKLRESEQRFRELFDRVPVAVLEQDLTDVGRWLETLRDAGVIDLEQHLREHPEALAEAARLTRTRRINQTAAEMFEVHEVEQLDAALHRGSVRPDHEPLILKLQMLWHRQHTGEMETSFRSRRGKKVDVFLRLVVPGDRESPDLSRVLLAMTDISANRQRIFAQAQVEQAQTERKRLGHELHDTLGQQLTGINMLAESLRRKLASKALPEADRVAELARLVGQANAEVRRLISGMTPEPIAPEQLESALQSLAEGMALVHQTQVRFEPGRPPGELDSEAANHLMLIAQEAAHNAAKHAHATQIAIALDQRPEALELRITDDGVGLPAERLADPSPQKTSPPRYSRGRGLSILRYRAEAIGATLTLAPAPGGGTTVRCLLPTSPPAPDSGITS